MLPERRKLGKKDEPLALMPPPESPGKPYNSKLKHSAKKHGSRNVPPVPVENVENLKQISSLPPDSQRQEVLDRISKAKNLYGPINQAEIPLPAWTKKGKSN